MAVKTWTQKAATPATASGRTGVPGAGPAPAGGAARRWWVLAVASVAQLMVVLDVTVVNIPGHREERLQVKGHRPQRVRPAPARHELQIPVHQPLTQPVTDLARPRHETRRTREAAHFSTIPACGARTLERHGSPVY